MERTARVPTGAARLLLSLGFVLLLYFGRPFFLPLSLAILLVLLLSPLVSLVQRIGLGRVPAVLAVVLVALVVGGTLAWVLSGQFSDLMERLPQYREHFHHKTEAFRKSTGGLFGRSYQLFQDLGPELTGQTPRTDAPKVAVSAPAGSPLEMVGTVVSTAVHALGGAAVVLLLVIFLLIYQSDLRDRLTHLAGVTRIPVTLRMIEESASHTSRYLLLQTAINVVYGALFAGGMAILGVPNAFLWGAMGFLLRYLPYLGPLLAAAGPVALSAVAFDGWTHLFLTAGFIAALEFVVSNVIEPVVYGKGTGLAPLAVVVSAIFWTCLWGTPGLILAVPITSALVTLGRHLPSLRFLNILLGSDPDLEPEFRLYHRLLANDLEGAVDLVEESAKTRTLTEIYDSLLIPALALAEQNRHLDDSDDLRNRAFLAGMSALLVEMEERPSLNTPGASTALTTAPLSIVIVPVVDEADELSARMLSRLLLSQGLPSKVLDVSATTGDKSEQVERANPDILCLSAIPPSAVLQTRYLLKRILARRPDQEILVGMWGIQEDPLAVSRRISSEEGFHVRTTLEEASREIREKASALALTVQSRGEGRTE